MNSATTSKDVPLWAIHALMVFSAIIVSSSFTVGAAITHGLDPAILLVVRYIIAVLVFLPFVFWQHPFAFPSWKAMFGYSAISLSTVGFFWCMFEALRYTTALNSSVIFALVPGISGIYSAIFLHERLGRRRLIALFFGMAGAIWVIFRGDITRFLQVDINYGDLLFLAGCFLMAAYTPLVKKLHRNESMLVMTFWVLSTGVFWLLLLALPRLGTVVWSSIGLSVWIGIVYLALFSTVLTFYLTHVATLYLGPTRVMAYSYCYPVFVLLIDWLMGNGLPPANILPGVLVVSAAIVVVQRGLSDKGAQ